MTTPGKVLEIARSQLGVAESPPHSNNVLYSRWYGIRGAWCAMFTSWCLQQAGMPRNPLTHFAWTPGGHDAYHRAGLWYYAGPRVGDLVFFSFSKPSGARPHGISHVGFVERVNPNGSLTCLEGNTNGGGSREGGSVMRHNRSVRLVAGYGRPQYSIEAPPVTEEDEVQQADIDRIAEAAATKTFDLIKRFGLAQKTKDSIAAAVWSHPLHGGKHGPAENVLWDGRVYSSQAKRALDAHREFEVPQDEEPAEVPDENKSAI